MSTALLPQTAEYALRTMAVLAALPPGQAARAADLARTTAVPRAYVSKIMRKLVVAELVRSQRGHGGGFVLTRSPDKIRFEHILAAMDVELEARDCAFGWAECNAERACPLHPAWSKLKANFREWCKGSTLADVDVQGFARITRRKGTARRAQ